MDFKQFFGEKEIRASWNVEDWDPIVLNVIMPGDKNPFAVVKVVDHDHLLVATIWMRCHTATLSSTRRRSA